MLGAFNEKTPDWLSFFMFTFFTDRDGKMQLESLAQSGFDPLSRTCRFMLTEEAHHMFVGETGVGRTIQRTCEAMKKAGIEDPNDIAKIRALGVIDLPTIQKKLNLHYSLTLDLFGAGFVLMRLGDDAPRADDFLAAAASRGLPATVYQSSQPDLVHVYEKPLVLVRPDGHVAWRGAAFPTNLVDLIDTIRGARPPVAIPRPEVGFGQRAVLIGPPAAARA